MFTKTAGSFLDNISISPTFEMGAYEALWLEEKYKSFKAIADLFRKNPGFLPSEFINDKEKIKQTLSEVLRKIERSKIKNFGTRIFGTMDYPKCLRDAVNPIEFFYYRGWWDIAELPKRIAVIGTRNPSDEGIRRAERLVKLLVKNGFTIISGLAKGIDTTAHKAAIGSGGNTIAVIGTPITECYPPENRSLQNLIAEEYLLISQIPIYKYAMQTIKGNRLFFPERNITMSALSHATVIVEASDTSGTLIQARAALQQGRKLYILESCFHNPKLTWPKKFEEKGAIRINDDNFDKIISNI